MNLKNNAFLPKAAVYMILSQPLNYFIKQKPFIREKNIIDLTTEVVYNYNCCRIYRTATTRKNDASFIINKNGGEKHEYLYYDRYGRNNRS